ncbi:MAG: hypothetical protein MJA27_00570 [Pseudanabaenales cyanobacterium]|nr:hypothetical protein [Pseudanabaenales cyanobacterium]
MQAVRRDEFETVKQLLASAARYAESANQQSEQNAIQIADNFRGIAELKQAQQENLRGIAELKQAQQENLRGIAELKQAQQENVRGIAELKQAQQENAARMKQQGERIDEFVFQVNRLVSKQQQEISQLKALCDRYDGVLAYLLRQDQGGGAPR